MYIAELALIMVSQERGYALSHKSVQPYLSKGGARLVDLAGKNLRLIVGEAAARCQQRGRTVRTPDGALTDASLEDDLLGCGLPFPTLGSSASRVLA